MVTNVIINTKRKTQVRCSPMHDRIENMTTELDYMVASVA